MQREKEKNCRGDGGPPTTKEDNQEAQSCHDSLALLLCLMFIGFIQKMNEEEYGLVLAVHQTDFEVWLTKLDLLRKIS